MVQKKTVGLKLTIEEIEKLKVQASKEGITVSDILLNGLRGNSIEEHLKSKIQDLECKLEDLLSLYQKATNKKPNLEKKKISITLTIPQAQALEDAAHQGKTTKSLLIGAVLERKLTVNETPQLM